MQPTFTASDLADLLSRLAQQGLCARVVILEVQPITPTPGPNAGVSGGAPARAGRASDHAPPVADLTPTEQRLWDALQRAQAPWTGKVWARRAGQRYAPHVRQAQADLVHLHGLAVHLDGRGYWPPNKVVPPDDRADRDDDPAAHRASGDGDATEGGAR
jgi:hypothetical protein